MLIAAIHRSPRLELKEWLEYIATNERLAPIPSREFINPFTGQKTIQKPSPAEVRITDGTANWGAIEPSAEFEHDGELLVFGPRSGFELAVQIARAVADDLGAEFESLLDEPEGRARVTEEE